MFLHQCKHAGSNFVRLVSCLIVTFLELKVCSKCVLVGSCGCVLNPVKEQDMTAKRLFATPHQRATSIQGDYIGDYDVTAALDCMAMDTDGPQGMRCLHSLNDTAISISCTMMTCSADGVVLMADGEPCNPGTRVPEYAFSDCCSEQGGQNYILLLKNQIFDL